jgi:hypothetical protein
MPFLAHVCACDRQAQQARDVNVASDAMFLPSIPFTLFGNWLLMQATMLVEPFPRRAMETSHACQFILLDRLHDSVCFG